MNLRLRTPWFFGLIGFFFLLLPNIARADSFTWTYQGTQLLSGVLSSASGELTTTDGIITELSGTINGLAITALLAPGAFAANDNVLLLPPAPLFVTEAGFSFLDSAGDQINIFAVLGSPCAGLPPDVICSPTNTYASISDDGNVDLGNFTLSPVTATREPGTLAMLSSVLALSLFMVWSRRRE